MSETRTICFTGRRPKDLAGYQKAGYETFILQLANLLIDICVQENKPMTFISGGAQGFDQLAFWAVDLIKQQRPDLTIQNVVYVPFKGQARAWKGNESDLFGQDNYNQMLKAADNIVYLKDELQDRQQIVQALLERNHHMVNDSDFVIALYPTDNWQNSSGGTAECMRYANDHYKDILQIKYTVNDGMLQMTRTVSVTNE